MSGAAGASSLAVGCFFQLLPTPFHLHRLTWLFIDAAPLSETLVLLAGTRVVDDVVAGGDQIAQDPGGKKRQQLIQAPSQNRGPVGRQLWLLLLALP